MSTVRTRRLQSGDREVARRLFTMMAEVFDEPRAQLGDGYLDALLHREDFWAIAAMAEGEVVGGLTAHALPMTRSESVELFIYDVAVRADWQRRGVGRQLVTTLREGAAQSGIPVAFVPAATEDAHALDFYRAIGGEPTPVVLFTFTTKVPDVP